jgi:hypothetical protein
LRRLLPILFLCVAAHGQGILQGTANSNAGGVASTATVTAVCNITTSSMPPAMQGVFYTATIQTQACVGALTFSIVSGSLPAGLTLNSVTGVISGTPTTTGTVGFTVKVVDSLGHSDLFDASLNITTTPGAGVPLAPDTALTTWDRSLAGTPTLNITDCVGTPMNASALPGGHCATSFAGTTAGLQAALNAAVCGHIINQAAFSGGVTIQYGPVKIPSNKKCPNTAWIIWTGDLSDPAMPAEGQRPDPTYAGIPNSGIPWHVFPSANSPYTVASRHFPQIIGSATGNTTPISLSIPTSGSGIQSFGHWRIQMLHCGRDDSADAITNGCFSLDYQPSASGQDCANTAAPVLPVSADLCAAVQPDHVIFDRILGLGSPQRQTVRQVSMGGGTFLAVQNSWLAESQDTFAGGQGDAQAIAGGFGRGYTRVGNWIFENNYTSSSTEGQILCGATVEPISPVTNSDGIPESVIWRKNHYYKPRLWDTQRGQPLLVNEVNEGMTLPPVPDQEIVWNPTAFSIQQGISMPLNNTWLYDSAGGWNRFGDTPAGAGTVTVDGVDYKTITSTSGIVTRAFVSVGSAPWRMENIIQWTYIACVGNNNPVGSGCTAATTLGTHTITFDRLVVDGRLAGLGGNRHLTTTITATVSCATVGCAPANQMFLTPSTPDLQIQPSYKDTFNNNRYVGVVFTTTMNFTSVGLTWKVDSVTNGNTTVGQICNVTSQPATCAAPGANDTRVAYISGSQGVASLGLHTITVTSAGGTVASQDITTSITSPLWGYDLKAMTVKNLWECKCIRRGDFGFSLLENTHGSQGNGGGQNVTILTQSANNGNQILDGSGATVNYGPQEIADLFIHDLHTMHTGGSLSMAALNVAKGMRRITVSNLWMEDLSGIEYGHGFLKPLFDTFVQLSGIGGTCYGPITCVPGQPPWSSPANPVAGDLYFYHVLTTGGDTTNKGIDGWLSIANNNFQYQMGGMAINNSAFVTPGVRPFYNNNGEANDCGSNSTPKTEAIAFQGTFYSPPTPCFSSYNLSNNLLIGNTAAPSTFVTPTIWQAGFTDTDLFRNYKADGSEGDYHWKIGSRYAAGGSRASADGSDLGVNMDALLANDNIVRWGSATNVLTINTGSTLTAATHNVAYTTTFTGSGGTAPYTWTITALQPAPGAQDILDYMCAPFRATQHLTGATVKYCVLTANLLMWIKGSSGGPADGEAFDGNYVYQWYTEGPTFSNLSGFKRYVNAVALWKRYHVPGQDDVVVTRGPNKYTTTESCGSDNLAQIDNLDVKGEVTGPFTDQLFQTDCIAAGGSTATCNVPDNTPYLMLQKFIKGTADVYQTRERYQVAFGYGQIIWDTAHLSGGSYVIDQTSTNERVVAGGNPTPNFPCGIPAPFPSLGLPPGTLRSSAPPMSINDATGVFNGTPSTVGNYTFFVQLEDAVGRMTHKSVTLPVN